jgi:hypothetical protein
MLSESSNLSCRWDYPLPLILATQINICSLSPLRLAQFLGALLVDALVQL